MNFFEEIERLLLEDLMDNKIEYKNSKNHFYTYNDTPVPSVTTILSKCIHEDYLMNWANYLGFKRIKYKDKLNEAATLGTMGHNAVEAYLQDGTESPNICLASFLLWWNDLNEQHTVKILGMEQKMILPYCGGTYDILLSIDDRVYLLDLKTSNNLSFKYFIQLAAYRHMLYKTQNMNIDGCIVLQLDKNNAGFNEQVLDFSINEHYQFIEQCAFTFISLVLSFYNVYRTEAEYKKLFT